ncbi:MAG: hypothetical protein IPL65_06765 [Lewinellaceae bacterium]|nr:hypothetical protein [Lewinellaceae bacterium]
MFVNRANPVWDLSLTQSDARNRVVVTTGFESRRNAEQGLHGRVNLGRTWSLETDAILGMRENDTENFINRNYSIRSFRSGPKLSWLPVPVFRLVGNFSYKDSRNTLNNMESAEEVATTAELSWNPVGKPNNNGFKAATAIRAKGTFSSVKYQGEANSPVAYAMLDGLQNGKNYLWSLSVDRQLSANMQLSLQYEGRRTGSNRLVHVGRAQVRALF